MEKKSSLCIYRRWKRQMGGMEEIYDNRPASIVLFKVRTNSLELQDRKRHTNEETRCPMCQAELENLEHFFITLSSI